MKADRRWRILLIVAFAALAGGGLVYWLPERAHELAAPKKTASAQTPFPAADAPAYSGELHERFQQAAVMLHAGQHEYALAALQRVIELAPNLPEARVNAGYALLGLAEPRRAKEQFELAIDLRTGQVNAYYGLALTLEALGDRDAALGAMRTYVHLAEAQDPHARKARSAIWEWQSERDGQADTREPALDGGG
jgi:tetratricopeptide (TPR) repeat protein